MTYFLRLLNVLDHVLVRLVRRIDARLGALNGERERVHDHDRMADDLPLHEPHDLPWDTGARVYDLKVQHPSDEHDLCRPPMGQSKGAPFLSEQLQISCTT